MDNKDKIIEEIAMIMCENNCEECRRESIEFYGNSYDEDTQCLFNVGAERLYNAGYRKIPEDSVVLTKEEYEELLDRAETAEDISNTYKSESNNMAIIDYHKKQERKETAREIFKDIKSKNQYEYFSYDDDKYCVSSDAIEELAKQYGVEIV